MARTRTATGRGAGLGIAGAWRAGSGRAGGCERIYCPRPLHRPKFIEQLHQCQRVFAAVIQQGLPCPLAH